MGVLDDAIRQHLELKRKHGVPEEELQRQEEEALGPARRDVAYQREDDGEPSEVDQETSLFDGEEAPEVEAPALEEEPPVAGQPPVGQDPGIASHPPVDLGETQPHGFEALEDEEEVEDQPADALEPETEAEPEPEPQSEDEPEPAAEHEPDDEDLLTSDPEDEELDVLEDTPDFLQETPEHDRLWFEQKPPRDFDFD